MRTILAVIALALSAAGAARSQSAAQAGDWGSYGRDLGGTRFSSLGQIDTANVARLGLAWVYRTGDLLRSSGRFEATPLVLDGLFYVSTPLGRVSALDPVSAWSDSAARTGAACARRTYVATVDARLTASSTSCTVPQMPCASSATNSARSPSQCPSAATRARARSTSGLSSGSASRHRSMNLR